MKTTVCPDLDYIAEFYFIKLRQFTCFPSTATLLYFDTVCYAFRHLGITVKLLKKVKSVYLQHIITIRTEKLKMPLNFNFSISKDKYQKYQNFFTFIAAK